MNTIQIILLAFALIGPACFVVAGLSFAAGYRRGHRDATIRAAIVYSLRCESESLDHVNRDTWN